MPGNKMNPVPLRQASIWARHVPVSVPAMTLNRVCAQPLSIVNAAQQYRGRRDRAAIAGAGKHGPCSPYLMDGGRWAIGWAPPKSMTGMLRDVLR